MNIIELNEGNITDYKNIIDPDAAENIGREFYHGIAAESDEASYSGALIWEYKNVEDDADTDAEIVFINAESKEVTKELLFEFDKLSSGEDVVRSFFEVFDIQDEVKEGFAGDGFSVSAGESRDLFVSVSDLSALAAKKKVPPKIVGLNDIEEVQFMQGVLNCLFCGKKGIVDDLQYIEKDWFDHDTSSAVITDGKISGMFLVHRFSSGNLMPVLLSAIGPEANKDLLYMLCFSAKKALEKYPGDTPVIIRRHSDTVDALAKKLFGEKTGKMAVKGERR